MPDRSVHSNDDLRRLYDGLARTYRRASWVKTLLGETRLRRALAAQARGSVLDVACGTGENFPYIPPECTITAIELSPAMLDEARRRAARLGRRVDLRQMDAQRLDFADGTFDTVISALSTCTFPDPAAALHEMARVCRADGQILLLEHGRSRWGWLARYQDRAAPRVYAAQGCRWNQDPAQLVADAGLTLLSMRRALSGIYYVMKLAPS